MRCNECGIESEAVLCGHCTEAHATYRSAIRQRIRDNEIRAQEKASDYMRQRHHCRQCGCEDCVSWLELNP